jgi:hypothetical protein
VNKDPSKRLPYALRETFLAPALRDQTSMQHPYGNLATNIMQNELGFLHPHPNLYVMPDDEKLGPFREEFGNMLGTLEEFPTTPDKGEASFEDAKEIVKSYELFAELYDDHDKRVDAEAYARVRVFDMLVGAWDRHKDNWRWAGYKEEGDTVYQPIPRDRDNVWTLFDGFFPWWLDREWAAPMFEDFEAEIKGLRSLNWQSRHLDRFLTSELTRDDWLEVTRFVQEKMTDEVLESAIRNMPAEIYEVSGGEILEKLKVRVKDLDLYVEEFYEGLAKEADVVGSNKDEYFEVLRQEDGSVEVSMYDEKRGEKGDKLLYNRTFFPNETKQIRLYGLGGDDVFKIKGETGSSIKIKIAGGRGEDTYDDQSDVKAPGKKTLVYEKDKEGDFQLGKEARLASSVNESVYDYDRTAFEYGTYLPLVWATYNSADRFRFGAGLKFTLQKYGKEDFSSDHFVKGIYTTENSKVFNYNVRFHQVIQNWDVELDGYIGFPDLNKYFFGIGNETVKDDDLFDDDFNTYNFNTYQGTLTLVHDFWKFSKFNVGLHYEYNDQPDPAESSINIFQTGTFFGEDDFSIFLAQVSFNLDFRDNEWLPESGWRLFLSHDNGWITSEDWENYGQTFGFVENFITARILLPWTFGFKAGAGHSYGDIPFYNEYSLGEGSYVRGWKKSRFTGENLTFVNSDLRVLLIDIPTKLLPTKFGVKGFFDFGKIIQIGEASDDLHYGYGFGVFLVAWQNAYNLHSSFGFSDEEVWEVNVSIGVAFQ